MLRGTFQYGAKTTVFIAPAKTGVCVRAARPTTTAICRAGGSPDAMSS